MQIFILFKYIKFCSLQMFCRFFYFSSTGKTKAAWNRFHAAFAYLVGPPGVEPGTNGLCLPATAFAAPFGFVVWTVSCLYDLPVQSLHVLLRASLGITTADARGFPEFEQFYRKAESTYFRATHAMSNHSVRRLRSASFKSAALTRHELEAQSTAKSSNRRRERRPDPAIYPRRFGRGKKFGGLVQSRRILPENTRR